MDHDDPRLMCLPASQDAAESSAPACQPSQPSDVSMPAESQSSESDAVGGFSAPVSPAARDLVAHWGSSTGSGDGQNDHAGAVNTLAAGILSPQKLPPGGEGPTPPWETGNPTPLEPSPLAPPTPQSWAPPPPVTTTPPPSSVAPLADAAPVADAAPAVEAAELGGIGLGEVLAPALLMAGAGYMTYSGIKAVRDPSFHEGPPAMGTGPHDMGVDEPPAIAPGAAQGPLDAPGATDGAAKVDVPGSTSPAPMSAPPVSSPTPIADPESGPACWAQGNDSDAADLAQHERYKAELRRDMNKPEVKDPALASIVDKNYRPNATVGSGSTAAAIREERATGGAVGGRHHTQKGNDTIVRLLRWLKQNPNASPGDIAAAENIIKDLKDALK
jgi:hypothetical protein